MPQSKRPGPDRGQAAMTIFGIAGWSGSGKTTLICALIPQLIARGLTVSTIKHAHHTFDIDKPGKDSFEHRRAGATEVLIASARRWALMHENRAGPEPSIAELVARMSPVDLLIVEGLKSERHPKLEVHRASTGKPLLCRDDPAIVAVAADVALPDVSQPVFDLDQVEEISDFIISHCGLRPA